MSEVTRGDIIRFDPAIARKIGVVVSARAEGIHSMDEMRRFVEKHAPSGPMLPATTPEAK